MLAQATRRIWLYERHAPATNLLVLGCGVGAVATQRPPDGLVTIDKGDEMPMYDNPVSVKLLQDFADAWNRHDLDALMSFMADGCVFHAVAGPDLFGRSFVGLDAVRDGFRLAWMTFPDAAWVDGEHFVCGERGVSESTFLGTKADGSRVEARMVDVFTFRDGKIAVKNAYRKDRPPITGA